MECVGGEGVQRLLASSQGGPAPIAVGRARTCVSVCRAAAWPSWDTGTQWGGLKQHRRDARMGLGHEVWGGAERCAVHGGRGRGGRVCSGPCASFAIVLEQ